MSIESTYAHIATAQSKATSAISNFVKEFFPFLILLLNIAVTVISRLFVAEAQNPFSPEFFVGLSNNLLSTTFCYVCFIGYGERTTFLLMPGYENNKRRWSELSATIRKESDKFVKYCKEETERERADRRLAYISNTTLLGPSEYDAYKSLTKEEIREKIKVGEISSSTGKRLIKASKIKVKPIKPLLILCGVQIGHLNEAGRDGVKYSTLSVALRPIIVVVTNVIISMLSGRWVGFSDPSVIYDMTLLALLIVISSVLGYSAGAESARREHDKIKARIFFLEKYEQS